MLNPLDPGRLNNAAFVVLFLVPGIREIELYPCEAVVRDAKLQNLDGIVTVTAQIAQPLLLDFHQQCTDTRAMDLDTDKILFRICLGHGRKGLAHAITDFQHPIGIATENRFWIQHALVPFQAKGGPEGVQSIALTGGQAAFAQDKTAHLTHDLAGLRVFVLFDEVEHGGLLANNGGAIVAEREGADAFTCC